MGEIRDKLQWYNESQAEVEKYLSRRKILINHFISKLSEDIDYSEIKGLIKEHGLIIN